MEFEYTNSFYVDSNDLREMYLLCKNKGYTPQEALEEVSSGWDDVDYYSVGFVEDQIIEEINRRLSQTNYNKGLTNSQAFIMIEQKVRYEK